MRLSLLSLFLLVGFLLSGCRAQQEKVDPASLGYGIEDTVEYLAGHLGERNVAHYEALEKCRNYITERLEKSGYEVELSSFEVKLAKKTVHNLIATLPGTEEILVIGAHYDTAPYTPGADDNGSGVAVLLQLAERLKKTHAKEDKTIRFVFFVNEEPPYFFSSEMGSVVYAQECADRRDPIIGMLSLETIGYYSDQENSQLFPTAREDRPTVGDFLAFVCDPDSENFLGECLEHFEGMKFESMVANQDVKGVAWSDHSSFWDHGYPGIMVTDTAPFRNPNYHLGSDLPKTLDYLRLNQVAESLENMITALAKRPEPAASPHS